MQYVKGRTEEGFDDYFSCKKNEYKLKHVKNWLKLFVVDRHKKEINLKWTEPKINDGKFKREFLKLKPTGIFDSQDANN